MNLASPRAFHRPFSPFILLWASCFALATTFMTGCVGSPSQTTFTGNTAVTLLASSTANDQFSELTLNITGITLTNQEGKTVTLLTTPRYVEFMHLNGNVEPLTTVSIPQDVYTSVTVSANFGVPLCDTYIPANGQGGTYGVETATPTAVTANLSGPLTVTGTGMGLELNLQVSKSTNYTSCSGIVYGSVPFSFTPTFNVLPVALSAQPTNSTNGMATGLRGMIGTVTAIGTSFNVEGDFGPGQSAPIWQVSTSGSTVFQGITSASQLAAGMPVDMDVAIHADGTLLATRVAVYDTAPSNLSFASGPQAYVTASIPEMSTLAVEDQGPEFLGLGGGGVLYNFSSATFQTSGQVSNVSTLPFAASFNAANMVAGQNLFVTTHSTTGNLPYQATTVTLLPQTINGTISAISSNGSFTTYTVTLAAYDLFPNLVGEPGQATLLTNPNTVVVYVNSNTQLLNSGSLAVGGLFRFNGLVFNDGGTLRMDCVQVNDGVAE
jgi:hypothetical protein